MSTNDDEETQPTATAVPPDVDTDTEEDDLGEDGDTRHAIVYQPVNSDTSEYEIFGSQEEAADAMQGINAAWGKRAAAGMPSGAIINGKIVTATPTHVQLTHIDLKKKKKEAKQRKADADKAAADALAQREKDAEQRNRESNVLGGNPDGQGNPSADAQNASQRNQL